MDSSNRAVVETGAVKRSKQRRRSAEERRRIIEATLVPGASVARVAQEHGVRASLVYKWRRRYGAVKKRATIKRAAKLLPVEVAEERTGGSADVSSPVSVIEIELPKGRLRIVGADAALLRAAVEILR